MEPTSPDQPDGISVVVPVYNSETSLPELARRLLAVLAGLSSAHEVIFVDDGSQDRSGSVLQDLARRHPAIRAIPLMRNYGQHNALLCGIRSARYGTTVTIDDDLQNPPEEIPKLLSRLKEGCDVVYGTPARETHSGWRNAASLMTKWTLQHAMGAEVAGSVSAFRVFRTPLRDAFSHFAGSRLSIDVLLTWGTTRFTTVAVAHEPRRHGTSQYTFFKLMTHAANMLLGFSTWPLRVTTALGLLLSGFGVCVLGYVIGRYWINHGSVPGFPFLACIIAIFSGAQLLCIGIIGEYLARIYARTMDQPAYVPRGPEPPTLR
ncbi:MAG: glycosyltransferase family 2 protein [Elusimicrobia bacterium]|nr:glycosyltransferase family 2 protein [Elusimicrobiota bacterium]